jgi:hypothetical protein
MPPSRAVASRRARVAAKARFHPDDPELSDDKADLKTEVAAEYIKRVIDTWSPPSDAQRGRLAELLRPARQAITETRLAEMRLAEFDSQARK